MMEGTPVPRHSPLSSPGLMGSGEISDNFTFSQHQYPKSRVIIIGDSGTGKTSLVKQLATGEFEPMCTPTIGIDYHLHTLSYADSDLPESHLALDIWDSAGQERFRSISTSYFKNISGVLLVFDLSNAKTFRNLDKWIEYVYKHTTNDKFVFLVVGNKCDLEHKVQSDEIEKFCSEHNLEYFETSSMDATRTKTIFSSLGKKMLSKGFYKPVSGQDTPIHEGDRVLSLHSLEDSVNTRGRGNCCVSGRRRPDNK